MSRAFFPTRDPDPADVCPDARPDYYAEYGKCSPIFSLPDILKEIEACGRYSGALVPGAADIAAKAEGGTHNMFYESEYPEPPEGGGGCSPDDDDSDDDSDDDEPTTACNSNTRKWIIKDGEQYLVQDRRFGLSVDKESLSNQIANMIDTLNAMNQLLAAQGSLPREMEQSRQDLIKSIPVLQGMSQDRWERYWDTEPSF